jgi:hypothetical protein
MHLRGSARLGSARIVGSLRAAIAIAGLVAGCTDSPVEWNETRSGQTLTGDALAPDGTLRVDSMAMLAARIPSPEPNVCPGSLVLTRAGRSLYAAWWRVRADSGALLLAAHSEDGGHAWSAPAPVDTTDQSVSGCRRAPPAIAADSASGYVHVVFALLGREGPGLFYAHSMDAGAMFHSAVPIFYGDRLGRASVASDGDVVAVAFEDPNSRMPRIGLALSGTMGHIFEDRLLSISDDNEIATRPLVAVRGRRIAVAWLRGDPSDDRRDALAVRTGTLR